LIYAFYKSKQRNKGVLVTKHTNRLQLLTTFSVTELRWRRW